MPRSASRSAASAPATRPAPPAGRHLRIGVVVDLHGPHGRAIAEGIASTPERRSGTVCELLPLDIAPIRDEIPAFDAFIAERGTPWLQAIAPVRPVVLIDDLFHPEGMHSIAMDHEATGQAAAALLQETAAEHFAFLQPAQATEQEAVPVRLCLKGFTAGLSEIAPGIRRDPPPPITVWTHGGFSHLARLLREAPRPIGILAADDVLAIDLLRVCNRLGLTIPGEVAVAGIDDNQLLCHLANPRLSSIATGYDRVAAEALRLATRLALGESSDGIRFRIPPGTVAARESTGHTEVDDPVLTRALACIRQQARRGLHVDEVAAAAGVSRRTLEQRFRERLGTTASDEIARARHALARKLLRHSDLSIERICESLHTTPKTFRRRFRDLEGVSPVAFRQGRREVARPDRPGRPGPARRRRYSIGIVGFTAWGSVQANLRGAALYARQCPEIEVHLTPPDDDSHDGYLIASNAPAVRAAVEKHIRLDKPLAFIDQHHFGPRSFSITGDNADYGRVAAAHLIARGNRHLAFYHHLAPNSPWWQAEEGTDFRVSERFRGFVEQARRSGIHPSEVPLLASADPEALKAWLRKLPRPVGILCFNDFWALRVIQACRALRLRVPEDVAVIGIDDHPLLCRFSTPTITSVRTGFIRAGYEGLALLHSVLTGSPVPRTTTPIPACAVIPRRSTWGYAAHDALLNRAFAFMQAHLAERLTIPDIAAGIGSHPRTLESHFERHLRSGVHAELQRMRIDHACRLLATTALSVKEVSAMAGFPHAQSLCRAFSQATGLTPLAWREHRGDSFAERPEPALPGTGAGS